MSGIIFSSFGELTLTWHSIYDIINNKYIVLISEERLDDTNKYNNCGSLSKVALFYNLGIHGGDILWI